MYCEQIETRLRAYLDGELAAAAEPLVRAHLDERGSGPGRAATLRTAAVVPEAEPVPARDAGALPAGQLSRTGPGEPLHAGSALAGAAGGDCPGAQAARVGASVSLRRRLA